MGLAPTKETWYRQWKMFTKMLWLIFFYHFHTIWNYSHMSISSSRYNDHTTSILIRPWGDATSWAYYPQIPNFTLLDCGSVEIHYQVFWEIQSPAIESLECTNICYPTVQASVPGAWQAGWLSGWVRDFSPWASTAMETVKEIKFGTKIA